MINQDELNAVQLNFFDPGLRPCQGVRLADLRVLLRNELSGYAAGTLISNDSLNDVERQFINDGISCLWPHDYEVVLKSTLAAGPGSFNYYYLPDDAEHVFGVYEADIDINNQNVMLNGLPHKDMWVYDKSFIAASTKSLRNGDVWISEPKKVVRVRGTVRGEYVVVRYARKWPPLYNEDDCIDPSPTRKLAIVYYACYQYFVSQMQVNTESIRYRNYQQIATQFQQYYQQQLVRDSKPLYIS